MSDNELARKYLERTGLGSIKAEDVEPEAWTNAGLGVDLGLAKGAAKAGRALMMTGAVPLLVADAIEGDTKRQDDYFEFVDDIGTRAVDHWTPDAHEVGKAGQVMGGLAEMVAPLMAGGGNPTWLMGSVGTNTSMDLVNQGVDGTTAARVGVTDMAATGLGFKMGFLGQSWLTRVGSGVGGNVALGSGSRAADATILEGEGYVDQAAQFDAFDPTAMAIDIGMGAGFGTLAHAMTPSQKAAVLTANNAKHFQDGHQPGTPLSVASINAHVENKVAALEALVNGDELSSVPHPITPDLFQAPATAPQGYTAFRRTLESGGVASAKNPASSASGIDQFTKGTWRRTVAMAQPVWAEGLTDAQLLQARFDPAKSGEMAEALDADNARILQRAGVGVDNYSLYAEHHFGAGRAVAFAKASDDTPMSSILSPEQMAANSYLAGKTKGQAIANWNHRTKYAGVKPDGSLVDTNPAGQALRVRLLEDPIKLGEEYAKRPDAKGGVVLNTDTMRELSPEYLADRTRSADVHEAASDAVKWLYADKLSKPTPEGRDPVVLFTAGGTGSGKTSAVDAFGEAFGAPEIIYDTNMSTLDSAVTKVEQALTADRHVVIAYVFREPVESLVGGAIKRAVRQMAEFGSGRTVPLKDHADTHLGVRPVIEALVEKYRGDERVEFTFIDNSRGKGNQEIVSLENLPKVEENNLRERLQEALETARAGGLDEALYRGFAEGSDPQATVGSVRPGDGRGAAQDQVSAGSLDPAEFPIQGADTTVVTERGLKLPVRYAVVDIADLVTSHDDGLHVNPDFPAELQPRDRSRVASEQQIAKIANDINPELLAESPKAADGAPIIGQDKVVESGNARTIALRRAYATGKADEYRQFLVDNAARFGLDPAALEGLEQPALVRVALADYDRASFARQANESSVAAMSPAELAKIDASRLPDLASLKVDDDGMVDTTGPFVGLFMKELADTEIGPMMQANGALSQLGQQRIRNAVFAKAYGDVELVAMLVESTDANVKNVLSGMLRASAQVAKVREMIAEGGRTAVDVIPDLVMAVSKFSQVRAQKLTVAQHLAQGDLMTGYMTGRAKDLLQTVSDLARAPKQFADFLNRWAASVDALGDPRQADLLGGAPKAEDLIGKAGKDTVAANAPPKPSAGLFNAAGRPTAEAKVPNITPENRAAYEAVAAMPDMVVMGEDGVLRPAADVLAEADAIQAQAELDARGTQAAIDCLLRNAA